MSWRQFQEWQQYAKVAPFGEERRDLRHAITAALIANANRDPKKRPRPYSPSDFMAFQERESPVASRGDRKPMDADGWKRMKGMARAFGGVKGRRAVEV